MALDHPSESVHPNSWKYAKIYLFDEKLYGDIKNRSMGTWTHFIYGKKMTNEYSQHNEVIILKHTVHVNQKVPNVKTENKN